MNECYFTPKKDTTSATICANCGKEKMLHTIGEGIKASVIIICKHENIDRKDGLDECLDCGVRNY